MVSNTCFVITRPRKQGVQLKHALQRVGLDAQCQPLFEYQPATTSGRVLSITDSFSPTIIIFVSVAAVEFAQQALPLKQWINDSIQVIAVGTATQMALKKLDIEAVCPHHHDTEGMLALPALSANQLTATSNVLIVRGNGGRELLATQLKQLGANVQYLESYQRDWLDIPQHIIDQWRQNQITGFIVTSNALLQRIVGLLDINDKYWQNTCLWVVASDRIKETAQHLGLQKVINSQGANDQAIIDALLNRESTND
ncbi:uroporphyrinogen-III synthase [Thalassotalea sp. G2M2-11]|uniref:uroporphyrinogen-III synthase n=1 Tax=Thalassotalea sp. G2M2-11 TaxID=2787627 RepID=UPI0019D11CC4|nr:uroporphyrinogen-III synthase [Thalassotalea sp. G2M2-11]